MTSISLPIFNSSSAGITDLASALINPYTVVTKVEKRDDLNDKTSYSLKAVSSLYKDIGITKEFLKEIAAIFTLGTMGMNIPSQAVPMIAGVKFWDESYKTAMALGDNIFNRVASVAEDILHDGGKSIKSIALFIIRQNTFAQVKTDLKNTNIVRAVKEISVENGIKNHHRHAKVAGNTLQIYTWVRDYIFPSLKDIMTEKVDQLADFAASFGSSPMTAVSDGIRFVGNKMGAGHVKNFFVVNFFTVESYWAYKAMGTAEAMVNKDVQVFLTLEILKRAAKIVTMSICFGALFVGFTQPVVLSIVICSLVAAALSLSSAVKKADLKQQGINVNYLQ